MGQILGVGITHYPGITVQGNLCGRIKVCLADPALPERLRSLDNWPEPMRRQWSTDEGLAHADAHRREMIEDFRMARRALDEFQPDFCVIWGDDQFENYREDCVPPFSVLAYDEINFQPWLHSRRGVNCWDEPTDKSFSVRGHRPGAKHLASFLINAGFDIAYAYKPLHKDLGHAFTNSTLFLDWDRKGFPYPLVPFTTNAYGRYLTASQGVPPTPSKAKGFAGDEDPPGPQPWRCFQIGAATARAFIDSPWRVALIASSSWSHSFLTAKPGRMYSDVEPDKRYFRGAAGRKVGDLAQHDVEAGGRPGPSRAAQLVLPGGRDGRAQAQAGRGGLFGIVDFELRQSLCGFSAAAGVDGTGFWFSSKFQDRTSMKRTQSLTFKLGTLNVSDRG